MWLFLQVDVGNIYNLEMYSKTISLRIHGPLNTMDYGPLKNRTKNTHTEF